MSQWQLEAMQVTGHMDRPDSELTSPEEGHDEGIQIP